MELLEHFKKWQAIYAVTLAIVVQFVMYGERIERLEKNYDEMEIKIAENSLSGYKIDSRLASIETTLEFIKAQLK